MKLVVDEAREADVYRGIVRINKADRKTRGGKEVREGTVCLLTANKKRIFVWARGYERQNGVILLDDFQRSKLELQVGQDYEFQLRRMPIIGSLAWAFKHPDPIYRVGAWLGTLSVLLGVFAIIITVVPL